MINLNDYHLHDLTIPYDTSIRGYQESPAHSLESDGWNATWLKIYSHAGTHMDAPRHFGVGDQSIDQFPVNRLMGRTHILRVHIDHAQQIIDIEDLEELSDDFHAGDNLLIQTGWHRHLGQKTYRDGMPRLSADFARWCAEQNVNMLGVEAPSVADVNNLEEVTQIHQILFHGNVIILEGLKDLFKIERAEVFMIALPLKITNGDGAPTRVVAWEKK